MGSGFVISQSSLPLFVVLPCGTVKCKMESNSDEDALQQKR